MYQKGSWILDIIIDGREYVGGSSHYKLHLMNDLKNKIKTESVSGLYT